LVAARERLNELLEVFGHLVGVPAFGLGPGQCAVVGLELRSSERASGGIKDGGIWAWVLL
jgi:hypothetical protein